MMNVNEIEQQLSQMDPNRFLPYLSAEAVSQIVKVKIDLLKQQAASEAMKQGTSKTSTSPLLSSSKGSSGVPSFINPDNSVLKLELREWGQRQRLEREKRGKHKATAEEGGENWAEMLQNSMEEKVRSMERHNRIEGQKKRNAETLQGKFWGR